ncbi:MAG: sigma-E factor negative regulatory protein [Gammaproteobacteria bacterium]|nr:sigma-E factor negative regulatory protein [Gammaproteobacteria bacterium]
MREADQELISRILDENISELETRRILKVIKQNPEAYTMFQRYSLIGHAMRGELPARLNQDFNKDVMNRLISKHDAKENVDVSRHRNKVRLSVALGVIAMFTALFFITAQNLVQHDLNGVTPSLDTLAEQESDEIRQDFILNPKAAEDFNSYIVNHAEYASPRVSIPHVRIVSDNRGYHLEHSDQ